MSRRIGTVAALAVASLALAAPALADPWRAARPLGDDAPAKGSDGISPSVVGVWAGPRGRFGVASAGAVLDGDRPRALPPAVAGDRLLAHAAAPSGEAVILSAPPRFNDYTDATGVTRLTVLPADGGAPSAVEAPVRPSGVGDDVALAIAPSGAAAAAWIGLPRGETRGSSVFLATRRPGEPFGPAEEVPGTTDPIGGEVALAVGDDGAVAVAYSRSMADGVVLVERKAGDGTLTRTTVARENVDEVDGFGLRLARARDGRLAVMWATSTCDACDASPAPARIALRGRDGRLGRARTIATGRILGAELTLPPGGGALVALTRATRKTAGKYFERSVVEAVHVGTAGRVRWRQRVSPRTVMSGRPRFEYGRDHWRPTLAVNAAGAALVAWRSWCSRCDDKLLAAFRPPGGRFRPAAVVSEPGSAIASFGAALGPNGAGILTWYEAAGPDRVSLLAATAPRLPGRASPRDARPPRVRLRARRAGPRRVAVRIGCDEDCSADLWLRGARYRPNRTLRLTMDAHGARTGTLEIPEGSGDEPLVAGTAASDRAGNVRTAQTRVRR